MSNQKVRKGEELNAILLKKYLQENKLINSVESELFVNQFTHGYSNLTYLLQIENKEYVLRKPPVGAIKRGHDMSREFKVQSGISKAFPKVPEMYGFCEDEAVLGSDFYIMEKVEGVILNYKEAKQRNIPQAEYKTIANSWLDTLVELHNVDYKTIGLTDLGRPEGYVNRQVTNWGKQYVKAKTDEYPEATKVMQWLEENQPKKYDYCLIHNDFKYDNVVFKDDSWNEVAAVLDWEMATLGDPLMDLGTTIAYWSMASDSDIIVNGFPSPTTMIGNPGRNELVEMYAKKSGRSINNLVFYYVYGLFKIAVIVQQIYYRYHKGLTKDKRFAHLNQATQLFCLMANQAIKKNRIEQLF